MLSGIATYLFGGAAEEGEQPVGGTSMTDSMTADQLAAEAAAARLKATPTADDEEWMIVDKSSRGASPAPAHPLENLLIEHPSMSVYHGPRGRPNSRGVDESEECSEPEGEQPTTAAGPSKRPGRVSARQAPHRPRAVAARAGMLAVSGVKAMQSAARRREARKSTRTHLHRANKTHEAISKCPRRKHLMRHRPSGCNNDRKSQ